MSISGISGFGGMLFLPALESTQATDATNGDGTCSNASSNNSGTSTNSTDATTTSGSAALSSEILALLIQLQSQSANGTTSSSSASSSGTTSAISVATSGTSSMTANPISSFFSSLDTDGNGSISESEFERFIENLGGTQSQADTLYSQLTQNSSDSSSSTSGLTEQQLAQDAFGYGPPPPPPSASQMANSLVNAMGGSDGQVTKSEFENFVTSNGGTTSEADQDFAALETSGSTTLSASDLQQAIQNQQSQASSSTTISPLLSWLDSLSATASGSPTA